MDFIINKVVKFKVMHKTYCYSPVKILTSTPVTQINLSIPVNRNTFPLFAVFLVLYKILHNIWVKYICIFIFKRNYIL